MDQCSHDLRASVWPPSALDSERERKLRGLA
jgi:hypothetical protein